MRKKTTGDIYRLFKNSDKDTILRKTNIRAFCIKHNLDYIITQNICLIDLDSFMNAVNINQIDKEYPFPRLRTKKTARDKWNASHRTKIKHHIIDKICDSGKVYVSKSGRYNIINYDELEQELIKELKRRDKY